MSVQVGQKAPDFKMQGILKGEIRDLRLEDFADWRNVPCKWRPGKSTLGKA